MSGPCAPRPVKLFVGLLGGDVDLLRRTRQLLSRSFGDVDLESDVWPFDQTDYYEEEMGPDLQRWFLSFQQLVPPDALADIKRQTNELEQRVADDLGGLDVPRPVNLDPGYLDLGKLVLATTKDRAHRIYLGCGIFAEVTLQFSQGAWQVQPWTYPDYQQVEYHAYFTALRGRYHEQLRALEAMPAGGDAATP